ncbi:hypothetical protein [Massilia sp. Root335]|uniref:hypothetical protein n=1 Tax=Massilia sp. Root335 TaxID=1736517 RepID=UPI000A76D454|nr:hypothetical protein [Massilia sp. Root335]
MISTTRPRRRTVLMAGVISIAVLFSVYLCLLIWAKPMFEYRTVYGIYQVWSDRPISPAIRPVLDDVTRRLKTSAVHDASVPVEIYICNAPWRMWLYGMKFSTRYGGVADVWLTRHVIIRAADIAANRVVSPWPYPIPDEQHRPLSYFIAHEITHVDLSRRFGRTMVARYPEWLMEGYPDYVGKGGDFDFDANRAKFLAGAPELSRATSSLYLGYHLRVAYLLDKKHWTLDRIFAKPPSDVELDSWLRSGR